HALLAAEASERRAERLQAATEAFTGALSIAQVGDLIVEQTIRALGAQSGALIEADRKANLIRFISLHGVAGLSPNDTMSLSLEVPGCVAVRTGEPVFAESMDDIQRRFPQIAERHRADGVNSVAAFPM